MEKKGVIQYSDIKGVDHKLIIQVFRENKEFMEYVPKFSLKRIKKEEPVEEKDPEYPKIEIEEGYQPNQNLLNIIKALKYHEIESQYPKQALIELVFDYIKENNLYFQKNVIKIDPLLAALL